MATTEIDVIEVVPFVVVCPDHTIIEWSVINVIHRCEPFGKHNNVTRRM